MGGGRMQNERVLAGADDFSSEERNSETRMRSSRYRFTRCIAKGGMGTVYVGVQRGAAGFERPVAIKRTHGHLLANPDTRETILREARNASAVRHPNVVSINDVEEIDGELLLVMDYIEGGSFSQMIMARKPIPLGVVLSIVLDACAGLSAIHTATSRSGAPLGVIHRDVSPQNILVGLDGAARITDFGIAKAAGDPKRTAKTVRRGKFGYMAPEYILAGVSSAGTDVFALGVVLWEGIAGRRLFKGESNLETIRLTVNAEVPSLRDHEPTVTQALEAVIAQALAKSPLDRFTSMADFGKKLEAAAAGLVASRADVSEWVAKTTEPRPSIHPTVRAETVSVSDLEIVDDAAAARDSRPSAPEMRAEEESPSDGLNGPPIAFNAPSPRRHRAFKLDASSGARVIDRSILGDSGHPANASQSFASSSPETLPSSSPSSFDASLPPYGGRSSLPGSMSEMRAAAPSMPERASSPSFPSSAFGSARPVTSAPLRSAAPATSEQVTTKKSRLLLALGALFVVAVVSSTAAIAYVGMAKDAPAASSQAR